MNPESAHREHASLGFNSALNIILVLGFQLVGSSLLQSAGRGAGFTKLPDRLELYEAAYLTVTDCLIHFIGFSISIGFKSIIPEVLLTVFLI